MARAHRVNPIDATHHVTNHRAGAGDLYLDDHDRFWFLRLLAAAASRCSVDILAYSLMGNHFHLVLYCPQGRLDEFMHYVQSNYARVFNKRHGSRGPVFERRYHNVLVKTDGQLHFTTRYVHRNALEIGFDIRCYPWSSYPVYAGESTPPTEVVPVHASNVIAAFSSVEHYCRFVETDLAGDKCQLAQGCRILGPITAPFGGKTLPSLAETAHWVSGSPIAQLTTGSRGRSNPARLAVVAVAAELHPDRAAEISIHFGFSSKSSLRTALNRAHNRHECDPAFRSLVASIRSAWLDPNYSADGEERMVPGTVTG